jgi:hypothetical protein
MSRIRSGLIEGAGIEFAGACVFCREPVRDGAFWTSHPDLHICFHCVWAGELGKLTGDAARDWQDVTRMLDATSREAWRALAIAQGRERYR